MILIVNQRVHCEVTNKLTGFGLFSTLGQMTP